MHYIYITIHCTLYTIYSKQEPCTNVHGKYTDTNLVCFGSEYFRILRVQYSTVHYKLCPQSYTSFIQYSNYQSKRITYPGTRESLLLTRESLLSTIESLLSTSDFYRLASHFYRLESHFSRLKSHFSRLVSHFSD